MRILIATSELAPYSRSGELAERTAALATALQRRGNQVLVATPRYAGIDVAAFDLRRKRARLTINVRGRAVQGGYLDGISPDGVPVLFVDQPGLFERAGVFGVDGVDFPDNDERFAFFCRGVLESARLAEFTPDVIHCCDWPTAPIPLLLQSEYRDRPELNATGTVLALHDFTAQGLFPPDAMMSLGMGWDLFTPQDIEFFGKVCFLKAGLVYADALLANGRQVALDLQTREVGGGLEGVLKERVADLRGILLGIDNRLWDPGTDEALPARYSADDLAGKTVCKAELQQHGGLPVLVDSALLVWPEPPTAAGGIDDFLAAVEALTKLECQFLFAPGGEPQAAAALAALADRLPHRVAIAREGDAAARRRMLAGADAVLLPARRELSGLTAMAAMRYGALPIARATGALEDAIEDISDGEGTGFKFTGPDPELLVSAVRRALAAFHDRVLWRRLVEGAMYLEFSWDLAARRHEAVYRTVSGLRR